MTVGQLKNLLDMYNDDMEIEVRNDNGDFDSIEDVDIDTDKFCTSKDYDDFVRGKVEVIKWRAKTVVKIY